MYKKTKGLKITDMVQEPARLTIYSKQVNVDDHWDLYLQHFEGRNTMYVVPVDDIKDEQVLDDALVCGAELIDIFIFDEFQLPDEIEILRKNSCSFTADKNKSKIILRVMNSMVQTFSQYAIYHDLNPCTWNLGRPILGSAIFSDEGDAMVFSKYMEIWQSEKPLTEKESLINELLEGRPEKEQIRPFVSELELDI